MLPLALLPNEEREVRVEVLANESALALDYVMVYVNLEGTRKGAKPFCEALDDGSSISGDLAVGDGIFTCIAPFKASRKAGHAHLFYAQADVDGLTVASRGTRLYVEEPLTKKVASRIADNQQRIYEIWVKNVERHGNTPNARYETLNQVRALPGIRDVEITGGGADLSVNYVGGVKGGLSFVVAGGGTELLQPGAGEVRVLGQHASSLRSTVGSNSVVIWDPGFFDFSEGTQIEKMFLAAEDPTYSVVYYQGQAATVEAVRSFMQYDTVVMVTHGGSNTDRQIGFETAEPVTALKNVQYQKDLRDGHVQLGYRGYRVNPSFIWNLPGKMRNGLVYNGSCVSGRYGDQLAAAFLSKGANSYIGFTRVVNSEYARKSAEHLFCNMLVEEMPVIDALLGIDRLSEQGIPDGYPLDTLDDRAIANAEAVFVGRGDLTYPTGLLPLDVQFRDEYILFGLEDSETLTAELENDLYLSCLTYDWIQGYGDFAGLFHIGDGSLPITSLADTRHGALDFSAEEGSEDGSTTVSVDVFGKYSKNKVGSDTTTVRLACAEFSGDVHFEFPDATATTKSISHADYAFDNAGDRLQVTVDLPEDCDLEIVAKSFDGPSCVQFIDPVTGTPSQSIRTSAREFEILLPETCPNPNFDDRYLAYINVEVYRTGEEYYETAESTYIEVPTESEEFPGSMLVINHTYPSTLGRTGYWVGAYFNLDIPVEIGDSFCVKYEGLPNLVKETARVNSCLLSSIGGCYAISGFQIDRGYTGHDDLGSCLGRPLTDCSLAAATEALATKLAELGAPKVVGMNVQDCSDLE